MSSELDFYKHYKELIHELKSPLDIIKVHAEYLKNNYKTKKVNIEDYLTIIISESERLEKLLQDVGDSIGEVTISLFLCNVNDTIKAVTRELKHKFEKKSILVKYDLKKKLSKIYVDENKIYEVLINVLNNAIFAVKKGGTIEIKTYDDELLYIMIKDNGRGIKKNVIKNIFNPFYTTKEGGSGLGLYISKRILEAHGGSITVSSVYNKGTEVLISLPISHKKKEVK